MKNNIEIENLEEIIKAMDVLPDKFQRRAILPILRSAGRPIIRAAKAKLKSYGSSYSNLAKSIGNITAKSKNPIIYIGPRVKGKWANVGYIAHWVEYGTTGIKRDNKSRSKSSVGNTENYALAISKGSKRFNRPPGKLKKGQRFRADQPARPFMRPAFDTQMNTVKEELKKQFNQQIDKQIKKLFPKI